MSNPTLSNELLGRIAELGPLAGDMRLGQLMATLGWLGEDMTGRGLWDIDDEELRDVIERFRQDLALREPEPVGSIEAPVGMEPLTGLVPEAKH